LGPTPQQAVDWLGRAVSVLTTTDPQASLADLDPLGSMIGPAHLVGLGEGTHGTREFFQMKHRILELLVRQKGFTRFAIEATSPEANDMNRYVLTGEGDPRVLLSRLYKWPWNTQEVLDMMLWMRQWNSTAAPSQKVQFLGFDMQSPGASMDSVQAFVSRVDSANASCVQLRYACLAPYRNHGGTVGLSTANYAALTAASKAACAGGLQEVFDLFSSYSANYQSASSAATFQLRLHDARLVQQFEAMASIAYDRNASIFSRDKSMAENVEWLRDQAGSDARIVLWAHNLHINSVPQFMGGYLRAAYGSDYVNLGFLFGHGGFNAVGANGEGLMAWTVTQIPANSIEAIFAGTGKQEALFDTRQIAAGGSAAAALRGPIAMRNIGAVLDPAIETAYFLFPDDFDLLIYLDATTPSWLLPFIAN
jgi:erythromycin esterase